MWNGSGLQVSRPAGGGWSGSTAIVTIADGLRVVVRRLPERATMFPTYDLRREHDCLRSLADVVPVPAVLGEDLEGDVVRRRSSWRSWMDVILGRSTDLRGSRVVHNGEPTQQRQFHEGLLAAIVVMETRAILRLTWSFQLRRPGSSVCPRAGRRS